MKKIMFNDKYCLTQAVLDGRKTMTRRVATYEDIMCPNIGWGLEGNDKGKRILCKDVQIMAMSVYAKGEIVAVAQPYSHVGSSLFEEWEQHTDWFKAGFNNKMFVRADHMPHHIRITDIKVERLQDISDEDCMKEGVYVSATFSKYGIHNGYSPQCANDPKEKKWWFDTPRAAFSYLIDKVSGKGTWEKNPWVFAYEFQLED